MEIYHVHPPEDEILSPLLTLGICKSLALTGGEPDTLERARRALELALRSPHLPAKVAALHGLLYLLQGEWVQSEELSPILAMSTDYLHTYLQDSSSPIGLCEEHQALVWALAFYLQENFEELPDKTWCADTLQVAISAAGKLATPPSIFLIILSGLERLIVASKLSSDVMEQILKLVRTQKCTNSTLD